VSPEHGEEHVHGCGGGDTLARWILRLAALASLSALAAAQLDVTAVPPPSLAIPRYLPFELRLQHSTAYANPFWDVSIAATFTSPGEATYEVEGFYYGAGTWMVRFMPLIEGPWTYSVRMVAPGGSFETRGGFACVPSQIHGPLQVDPDDPERLIRDDGTQFHAIGTNFYTYEHPSINGLWTAPSDSDLAERWSIYFQEYRAHGADVWRRIVGNESAGDREVFGGQIGIWYDSGVDQYSLSRSLDLDTELREAHEHNLAVILALLGPQRYWNTNPLNACNGGPFPPGNGGCDSRAGYPDDFFDLGNTLSARYHRKYFRYMVARYSAFVDVWELFNEYDESDEFDVPPAHGLNRAWKAAMADYVRQKHPYHDLVATTRTRNGLAVPDAWQDLHVAHCYSYDAAADLCLRGCGADPTICARGVDALLDSIPRFAGRPDLVDEFGFSHDMANDDPDHHRIGIWTALHLDSGTVFWDANSRVDCTSPLHCPQPTTTSAYLDDSTRDLFLVRQQYAAKLPNTMRAVAVRPVVTPGQRIRAYALEDRAAGVYSAYIHHHADHGSIMSSATISIDGLADERHEAVWIDPKTGATVTSFWFFGPRLVSKSIPAFVQDIALLIRPDSPVEILTTSLPPPARGVPYHRMLQARGGGRPYTWTITSGALPVGMALDPRSGLVSGTPQYGGSYRFTVEVVANPLTVLGASADRVSLSIQWTNRFESVPAHDGAIQESAQGSGVGGTTDPSIASEFGLGAGDSARNQGIVTILSFDTSTIPDSAVIDSARLVLTCNDAVLGAPLALGPLYADVESGVLGAGPQLEAGDFQSSATAVRAASLDLAQSITGSPPWTANLMLDQAGRNAVNKAGWTQIRVHLGAATDSDGVTDLVGFCPGECADPGLRPRLLVTFH
jgi:hypothetical protein